MNSLPNSVPRVLSPFVSVRTFSAYDWYSACLLLPWQEPTQKTSPTTITIAIAISPTRRASGTSPVGARSGARGGRSPPPRPPGRSSRGRRRRPVAAAAARLRHRSCLRAYAFRRDSRHVYIAYEFVPGRTFREALRAGELNDAAALEACGQICDGLAHAHAAGILHRDVKPSNVLLADGERVSVRLLDFGLARMAEAETLTAQGDVPGTLAYISPERLAGDEASEASDVWAVGVMLWEALSGQHPFWQASMLDTARAIEQGAPSLVELRPDLPKALIGVVDRALSGNPARRPSALELATALRGAARPTHRVKRPSRGGSIAYPHEATRLGSAAL